MSTAPAPVVPKPAAPAAGTQATAWAAALLGVLIAASYPAVSRVAVQGSLTPQDLLVLRFGVSGLLLLPFLIRQAPRAPRTLWRASPLLALLQGWGPAACVLFGLQFTTAVHASALFQGSLSVWVALLGFALFGLRPGRTRLLGIGVITLGTAALVAEPASASSGPREWLGDSLLLCAPLLASGYLLYVQRTRLSPLLGVALVAVVSAALVLPWALWNGHSTLAQASLAEILWQVFFQGVLIGCVGMLCLHHAVLGLGGQAVGAVLALVPVLGLVFSVVVARESITLIEGASAAAISVGVWLATRAPSPVTPR
jgi:drug/metabolite transporter (DMT)-like permease